MENNLKWWKIVLMIFFVIMIVVGIFGALCGGFFIVIWGLDGFSNGGYNFPELSIGSLVIGILLIIIGFYFYRKFLEGYKQEKVTKKKSIKMIISLLMIVGGIIVGLIFLFNAIFDNWDRAFFTIVTLVSFAFSYGGFIWFKKLNKFGKKYEKVVDNNENVENIEKKIEL